MTTCIYDNGKLMLYSTMYQQYIQIFTTFSNTEQMGSNRKHKYSTGVYF